MSGVVAATICFAYPDGAISRHLVAGVADSFAIAESMTAFGENTHKSVLSPHLSSWRNHMAFACGLGARNYRKTSFSLIPRLRP